MDKLIAKIRNTRDYENLKEILGKELGTLRIKKALSDIKQL